MGKIGSKDVLSGIFRQSPTAKVLDYLIANKNQDFSITDIAKSAGIGRTTLHEILPSLVKDKLISHTRTVGRAKLYQINSESEKVKEIIKFYDSLRKHDKNR